HRFVDVGHRRMGALAHMLEDRFGEGLRLGDVSVDARVFAHRIPCPSINRMTPIAITNILRLRPALRRESMPTTAPMIANVTISQFAQPRNGRKARTPKTSATKPMINETRLNIAPR